MQFRGGPRGRALPLILDQTEAEGPKKIIVETWLPLSQGLDNRASPLSEHLDPPLQYIAQMYHDQDTFDFSQGHVSKNRPMAVPV